jgi:hypothetical protein
MLSDLLKNNWIQLLIVVIIVIGICLVAKINFNGTTHAGSNGIGACADVTTAGTQK